MISYRFVPISSQKGVLFLKHPVESHMRYADVIWGSLSTSRKESLQRLQDRAIFIIETSRIKQVNGQIVSFRLNNVSSLIMPLWPV